jgi:hypothetical protein
MRFGFAYCSFSSLRRFSLRRDFYCRGNREWRARISRRACILQHDIFDDTRWDETLKELHEIGIGDFNELVDYEGEPADYDMDIESWHDLGYFEDDFLIYEEEEEERRLEKIRQEIADLPPVELLDPEDEEEAEEPEESWADIIQQVYRAS